VDELIGAVFQVIDSIQEFGPDTGYINKVRETQRRTFESQLEQNQFWLSVLVFYAMRGQDPAMILDYPDLIKTLSPEIVQHAAEIFFDSQNYVQVVLKPEKDKPLIESGAVMEPEPN
jgi:zinc protease